MASLYRMTPAKISGHIATAPPAGTYPITNVYFDPALSKMVGEYDDTGVSAGTIQSTPPAGKFAVTNIFFDPVSGRMTGEYDDGA